MVAKLLFVFMVGLLSLQNAFAQKSDPQFSIGPESQLLIAGELNSSFDLLVGAKGYYFFSSKKKLAPFISVGFATDFDNANARVISTDFQLGASWDFSQRFSLLVSLGGNFINESHAHSLIEQNVIWDNTILGVSGNLGLNFRFTDSISSIILIKQTNSSFTSIGLVVNYSF